MFWVSVVFLFCLEQPVGCWGVYPSVYILGSVRHDGIVDCGPNRTDGVVDSDQTTNDRKRVAWGN